MKYEDIKYIHDLLEIDVDQKMEALCDADEQVDRYISANFSSDKNVIAVQNDLTRKRDLAMQQLNISSSAFESFKNINWYMKG